jgi:predicted dehydrogenase
VLTEKLQRMNDMKLDFVRWGIIGCGNVTEVKSGPAFQKANGSSLVAVMRRNGELARDYARRHGVPKWYDDARALIADPEVDAIYVATPPGSHKEYALLAAQAGKPVYVEKPMALNSMECHEMIAACRAASVPLFVAYYRRALPRFLKVKELIESGAVGEIRYVTLELSQRPPEAPLSAEQLPWRLRPELSGGGYFMDLACHTLDLLDYLLGPVSAAHGFAGNQGRFYSTDDIVSGTWTFQSGGQATGTWCFTSFEDVDRVEIVGSLGKLTFASFANVPITLTTAAGREEWNIEHPAHIQQPLIQQIVDELRGIGKCVSTGESATRTTQVLEQLRKVRF